MALVVHHFRASVIRCLRFASALVLAAALLPGCGILQKKRAAKRAAAEQRVIAAAKLPHLIGTITLVNSDAGFVLIDNGSNATPASGAELKTRSGEAESGSLRVSEIRRRPFVIADIVQGSPQKGDLVFR